MRESANHDNGQGVTVSDVIINDVIINDSARILTAYSDTSLGSHERGRQVGLRLVVSDGPRVGSGLGEEQHRASIVTVRKLEVLRI